MYVYQSTRRRQTGHKHETPNTDWLCYKNLILDRFDACLCIHYTHIHRTSAADRIMWNVGAHKETIIFTDMDVDYIMAVFNVYYIYLYIYTYKLSSGIITALARCDLYLLHHSEQIFREKMEVFEFNNCFKAKKNNSRRKFFIFILALDVVEISLIPRR